jgi:hypothetical protein
MSNYLAIATVTATLQRILQSAIQVDVEGARVTTNRPGSSGGGTPESGVNIYLYDVSHNPSWRSTPDLSARRGKGEIVKPRLGVDLYYLLSFYGNEIELEPQRLLGSVISTLQERRVLSQQMILDTIADSTFPFLANSDLAEQVESVKIVLVDLSLEDLSKIWSVFFQTTYSLSIAYQATAILIEGEELTQRALPARDRAFGVMPFAQQPIIERIMPQTGVNQAILADSVLLIQGRQLRGATPLVRIGNVEVPPQEVSDTQIRLQLSSLPENALRPGVQSLQVIHPTDNSTRNSSTDAIPAMNRNIESNAAAFILRPTITDISASDLDGTGNDLRSAKLTVQTNLFIGKNQRVILLLNERSIDNPAAYTFAAAPRSRDDRSLIVPINNVKAGAYLVRLQVDGAESLLSVDPNPNSRTFNWYSGPHIVIS